MSAAITTGDPYVLEDLPLSDCDEGPATDRGWTLFETAEHIDRKATVYEQANTICKQ